MRLDMDNDMARKFGQMESRLDAMEDSVDELKLRMSRIETKLDLVVEKLAANSGGTKMLVTLLTLSAAVGGILTKVWEMVVK